METLINKLREMQCELHAPKNQYNSFGGYKYRSLEDIAEALKPLEQRLNVSVVLNDEVVEIGGRVYVKATATLYNCEECEKISVSAFAREEETKKGMDAAQITGSASSYARKYALNGLFLIDDVKDPDATNKHGKEDAPNLDSAENVEKVLELAKKCTTKKELTDLFYSLNAEMQTAVKPTFSELKAQFK